MSYKSHPSPGHSDDPTRVHWASAVLVSAVFLLAATVILVTAQPQPNQVAAPLTFDESVPEDVDVGENRPVEIDVSTEPAADTIEIQSVEGPATVVLNNTLLRIEPEPEADGTVQVNLQACLDGECVDRTIIAEIIPENDPPLPGSDEATATATQRSLRIPVLDNDVDDEGHVLAIESAAVERGEGSVTVIADNTELLFTPAVGAAGDWELSYIVSDGEGGLAQGSVTVRDADLAPRPRADDVTVTAGQSLQVEVLENDVDDGGVAALRVSDAWIEQTGGFSAVEISVVDSRRIEIIAGTEPGTYEVLYVAEDQRGRSTTGVLNVTIESVAPTAVDDEFVVVAGSAASIDVLANDLPAGALDPTTLRLVSSNSDAVGISLSDYSIVYEPRPGESGNVELTYEICNGAGQCDTASLNLVVQASGFGQGRIQISGEIGQQVLPWQIVSGGATSFPANVPVSITSQGDSVFSAAPTIDATGALTITPVPGADGTAIIVVNVDGRTYQITVVVTP